VTSAGTLANPDSVEEFVQIAMRRRAEVVA
jgi:hypothetical protein